ncbi:phage virion morphogenesis (putative tail completion) protein [Rhizobium sp. RU35A]|uniref:phage virion morphogenesis protein n=1 Tax=Rhizobium sp. RU35A TaxID=1907414 RepID=UPI000953F2D4|nr:phage virion morphogenesis protein [Rhizobium sp. RU35A]SIR43185.1 phage virion morphogenesis (putative tail completion) protein [Rhizobium sp. RU35A]
MTGASLEIRDELDPALNRLVVNSQNSAEIMDAIAGHLLFSTQRRFETETAPDGQQWKQLSPRTAAVRRGRSKRGFNHILRDRLRLYESLQTSSDATSAVVGTNVVYAAIHQFGGPIEKTARTATIYQNYNAKTDTFDQRFRSKARSNFARDVTIKAHVIDMPARPYLGFNDDDRAAIAEIIADHIGDGLQ